MNKLIVFAHLAGILIFTSCDNKTPKIDPILENIEFGFNIDNFVVKRDTIKPGDSFGEIMEKNKIGYPKIYQITNKIKDSLNL